MPQSATRGTAVLMHGYAMTAGDLSPFGASLGVPMRFIFPESRLHATPGGKAWWPIDEERRSQMLAMGARDLVDEYPAGLAAARAEMLTHTQHLQSTQNHRPLIVGGFSQGGMLACDVALHAAQGTLDGLILMSASRLAFDTWLPLRHQLCGLPIFISHGNADSDLAFAAGERLAAFAREAGAQVTWQPFDGGHEIPLPVWRALRRFLNERLLAHDTGPSNDALRDGEPIINHAQPRDGTRT